MSIKSSTSTGIHTNHNPPVSVAAAAAATTTVAAAVAAAVAGEAAKDLGRVRPVKDLGCRIRLDRDETASKRSTLKDLGRG